MLRSQKSKRWRLMAQFVVGFKGTVSVFSLRDLLKNMLSVSCPIENYLRLSYNWPEFIIVLVQQQVLEIIYF